MADARIFTGAWFTASSSCWFATAYARASCPSYGGTTTVLMTPQKAFLESSNGLGYGVAVVPKLTDQLDLLEVVCRRFPQSNILAVAANNEAARVVAKHLEPRTARPTTWGYEPERVRGPRVHVDAVGTLYERDSLAYGVVIFMGQKAALSWTSQRNLSKRPASIRFLFLEHPLAKMHAIDRLRVEAFFGPCIFDASMQHAGLTTINVVRVRVNSYPASGCQTGLSRKRDLIWHNEPRNRQVAALAHGLRRGDQDCLQPAGVIRFGDLVGPVAGNSQLAVTVMVEGTEHARSLAALLPDWESVLRDPHRPLGGMDQGGIITTLPVAEQCGLWTQIVIDACGATTCWHDSFGPACPGLGGPMLLVDVGDDCDDLARRQVVARSREYQARGWIIAGDGDDEGIGV
jgi:hypothetical protein